MRVHNLRRNILITAILSLLVFFIPAFPVSENESVSNIFKLSDACTFDELGEVNDRSHDILGVYRLLRDGNLYIAIDLLELDEGDTGPDIRIRFVLPGGQDNGGLSKLNSFSITLHTCEELNHFLDRIVFKVPSDELRAHGLEPVEALRHIFEVDTLKGDVIIDRALCGCESYRPLKLGFILHGNQPLMNYDLFRHRYDYNDAGLKVVLDIIQELRVPIELHLSGPLLLNLAWFYPEELERLKVLYQEGLVQLEGGTWAEHIMPYFPQEVNVSSVKLYNHVSTRLGLKLNGTCWVPERVADESTLKALHVAGCETAFLDFPPQESECPIKQPVKFRGLVLGFIDHPLQYRMFETTGEGIADDLKVYLYKAFRRLQNESSCCPLVIGMNDMEFAAGLPFGTLEPNAQIPDKFRRTLLWLKGQPWIELTFPSRALRSCEVRNYDGEFKLQSYLEVEQGEGIIWRWMYGGSDVEPYYSWHPYLRGSWTDNPTRLKYRIGDFLGKHIGIGFRLMRALFDEPISSWQLTTDELDSNLLNLAKLMFLTDIYETAWHEWHEDPYIGRKPISYWERAWMSDIRQANIMLELSKLIPEEVGAYALDMDMDGQEEGLLVGRELIAVIEPVGGRVKFLCTRDGVIISGGYLNSPTSDGEALYNPYLERYGAEHARHRGGIFLDLESPDTLYSLKAKGNRIVLYSTELELMKEYYLDGNSLSLKVLRVPYHRTERPELSEDYEFELSLAPDYLKLINSPEPRSEIGVFNRTEGSMKRNPVSIISTDKLVLKFWCEGCEPLKSVEWWYYPYQVTFRYRLKGIYRSPKNMRLEVIER